LPTFSTIAAKNGCYPMDNSRFLTYRELTFRQRIKPRLELVAAEDLCPTAIVKPDKTRNTMLFNTGLQPRSHTLGAFSGHFCLKGAVHQDQLTAIAERRILLNQLREQGINWAIAIATALIARLGPTALGTALGIVSWI
jgi:hypothetical protein